MVNPPRAINVIVQQLHSALSSKKRSDGQVNSLIDEFNNLPFTKNECEYFAIHRNIEPLTKLICEEIIPCNEILTSKTSNLLHKLFNKTNHEFSEELWETVTMWRIESLHLCSGNILTDVVFHMHESLPKRTYLLAKHAESLIGSEGLIIKILKDHISNQENCNVDNVKTSVLLVRIISYLTMHLFQNPKKYTVNINKEVIAGTLMELLMNGVPKECEFFYNMALEPALQTLSHLFYHNPDINFSLSDAISIARHFILYGLSIRNTKPEKLTPIEHADVIEPVKISPNAGKKQKLRKPRNNAIENLKKETSDPNVMKDVDQFSSDSVYEPINKKFLDPPQFVEYTDTSTDFSFDMKYRSDVIDFKAIIRQCAAKLFLVIIKVKGKREIFPYWYKFMPNNSEPQHWFNTENGKKSLIFCALTDSSPKGRTSALGVVLTLLSGSRPYLAQAETSTRVNASVVPFPVTLGYMLTCIHIGLINILTREKSESVAIMALKCTAALAQATPYHKLQPGLIDGLIRCTKKFINQKDINIQLGSLVAIGSMISVDPKVDEILRVLKDDEPDVKPENPKTACANEAECDDFEESYPDEDVAVTIERQAHLLKEKYEKSLQLTSWVIVVCFKNFGIVFHNNQIMNRSLPPVPIILETLQVLSAIAFHYLGELLRPHLVMMTELLSDMLRINQPDLTLQCAKTISVIADGMQKLERTEYALSIKESLCVWEKLLHPLCGVLQSRENPNAKAVVCDCIANIGEKCFKEMLRPQQMLCCALLMGSCCDSHPAVRAAAVRALAMAVMYRTLREYIRLRYREVPELDRISDNLLVRLMEASVVSAIDNDKVKMSAMRAIGNLLRILTRENLAYNPTLKPLFETGINRLLGCANHVASMKVRWNACYALGNVLKNEYLFICFQGWQAQVLPALCNLAQTSKNIKVRITAAVALRSCARRWQVGALLPPLWRSLLEALDSAAHLDDFSEYKHKDNLAEQLCVTIAHICCLLEPSDLADILDPLTYHGETAKTMFAEVYHKLLPEDISCFKILQAAKYVNMDLVPQNEIQARALNILKNIFLLEL
ncbi:HEAT repeat-containing protein 6 [Papilio machaon]|uniref:HEAT repeat-containing protein 6 n=1 Tax=Papilio machaon TaxID=76193 RepID=A0A194QSM9_PAPMA|nr:HEAT repeat-containing protein 6 [Papilio machaon]